MENQNRVIVIVRERPNSRLLNAMAERCKIGGRIRVTDKPAPKIRDIGKTAKKVDGALVARTLGVDDWIDFKIVDHIFRLQNDSGQIQIVFKPGIKFLGSPDHSVEFGDDGGVRSFLGRDIVVRAYEEGSFRQLWPVE